MTLKSSIKIVIAEDDFLVRKATERTIKNLGHKLLGTASTGREAIEQVALLTPDVVIMDIKMPDIDGLEATRLIQESTPTPVVILSAHQTENFVKQAYDAGAGAYIIKPPEPEELERGIQMAMARHADLDRIKTPVSEE